MRRYPRSSYSAKVLSREQRELIGGVAAEWAYLESMVNAAIAWILDLKDPQRRVLLNPLPDAKRIDVLLALAELDPRFRAHLARVRKLAVEIRRVHDARNNLIHATWNLYVWQSNPPGTLKIAPHPERIAGELAGRQPKPVGRAVHWTPDQLRRLIADIDDAGRNLMAIWTAATLPRGTLRTRRARRRVKQSGR